MYFYKKLIPTYTYTLHVYNSVYKCELKQWLDCFITFTKWNMCNPQVSKVGFVYIACHVLLFTTRGYGLCQTEAPPPKFKF